MRTSKLVSLSLATLLVAPLAGLAIAHAAGQRAASLLNVSYDPTRELYVDFDNAFARYWQVRNAAGIRVQGSAICNLFVE